MLSPPPLPERAGSRDQEEAVDWSVECVAFTALSAQGDWIDRPRTLTEKSAPNQSPRFLDETDHEDQRHLEYLRIRFDNVQEDHGPQVSWTDGRREPAPDQQQLMLWVSEVGDRGRAGGACLVLLLVPDPSDASRAAVVECPPRMTVVQCVPGSGLCPGTTFLGVSASLALAIGGNAADAAIFSSIGVNPQQSTQEAAVVRKSWFACYPYPLTLHSRQLFTDYAIHHLRDLQWRHACLVLDVPREKGAVARSFRRTNMDGNAALASEFGLPFSDLTPTEREMLLRTRNSGMSLYEDAPELPPTESNSSPPSSPTPPQRPDSG
ncbi:hypothetical protein HPB47_016468 [Ixodes persulcatus]|uniref:Uncharacterized protein n=1 Tax=Ixodes persulcatus TaxID=34615 RepID=A0AC60QQT9_IXOPE|nr:hypothetical protein HPB47_016468 [Ixodes persulcatus]